MDNNKIMMKCATCDTIVIISDDIWNKTLKETGQNPSFRMDKLHLCCDNPSFMIIFKDEANKILEEIK